MRLKGINPLEQHAEKIVLVVFSAGLLGLLVIQFLGEPNAVEVGGRTVPPEDARSIIRDKALQKKGQLESIEIADELQSELVDYVTPFRERLDGAASAPIRTAALGEATLSRADTPGGEGIDNGTFVAGVKLLHVPAPPAPGSPLVAPFEGAVHPVDAVPVAGLIPQLREQPYDLRGVSVQAAFDAPAFKAALGTPPDDRSSLPTDWLRTIQILDVQLWRERLEDGRWVDRTLVEPMPGRPSLRRTLAQDGFRPAELPELLRLERENRDEIRTPAMYRMIAGLPWVEPADFADLKRTVPDQRLVASILRNLENVDTQIQRLTERREGLSDPEGRNAAAAQRLDRDLENEKTKRDGIVGQLADLGVDEEGNLFEEDAGDGRFFAEDDSVPSSQGIMDSLAPVALWAHDVTLEFGSTYRYKLVLSLTNPLFGRQSRIQPEQKDLAQRLTLETGTPWSEPIALPEPVLFFALDASPAREANGINQPASAEVIAARFFYGYWRLAESRIQVGSLISAESSLPSLWTWAVEPGDAAVEIGDRRDLNPGLPIETGMLLMNVVPAASQEHPSLGIGVAIHGGDQAPAIRNPAQDRSSQRLSEIRFSARRGDSVALPESIDEEDGG